MKKLICILTVCFVSLYATAQDDRYYDNSGDDVYTNDGYNEQAQDNDGMTYQAFYDQLNPYGSWIQDPRYGYVWVPLQAGIGFSPYVSNGHWVYTDYGWTWVSDFEWGWATFHYGRWFLDSGYGWMWMPGYDWAPAWVVWGEYNNYYCWAPVGPGEYISRHYGERDHHWNFVDRNHIVDHQVSSQVVSNTVVNHDGGNIEQHINIINHVSSYKRGVFFAGPKVNEVQKVTGQSVEKVNIAPVDKAGATRISGNQVTVYRPDIKRVEKQNATPARISRPDELQRSNTPATSQPQRTEPQRNTNMFERQQPTQQWTPPRQSAPVQAAPQRAPMQERGGGFVPSGQPSYSAPQQRQFSAPAPVHQSAPAPAHFSGGGRH